MDLNSERVEHVPGQLALLPEPDPQQPLMALPGEHWLICPTCDPEED